MDRQREERHTRRDGHGGDTHMEGTEEEGQEEGVLYCRISGLF